LIDKGRIILDYQTLQVKRVIKQGFPLVNIAGYQVPCINISTLTSEVGNELSKGHAFAAMYFETTDKRVYCLRSASDGIDVSAIAQKFGGGGHFHAAGFSVEKPLIDLAL
jgi:oligoribonuclease NrnB/cAMP/cGMP phosphodiesterase (DHH superfamily)